MASRVIVCFLFVGSGFAALVYELVWFQLLELSLGSSAASISVLLSTFMGGMFIGSLLAPRLVGTRHPLRVFAALEAGIAAAALVMLWLMPAAGRLYIASGGDSILAMALGSSVAALCLLPPTIAMGATLPVVGRWVEAAPPRAAWLGALYAGNVAGAAAGCIAAAFYLLRVYDVMTSTYVAVGIDVVAAGGAVMLAGSSAPVQPSKARREHNASSHASVVPRRRIVSVLVAIGLSGFCALAGEVLWTRLLALMFGATVYTFAVVLAVFLVGLALGSAVGSLAAATSLAPQRALAWTQLLVVAAIAWTAYMVSGALPYWPIIRALSPDVMYNLQLDFGLAVLAVLPAPLLWGASFPLALAALAGGEEDGSRLVSRVYAANTLGAIAGAVIASMFLVGAIGSKGSQQVMMALAACASMLMFAAPVPAVVAAAASALLIAMVPDVPGILIAYGRNSASWVGHTGEILFAREGVNSSVAVSRLPNGVLTYHNAGKIQASSQPQDMRLQRMLGHVTTLIPDKPESVLVIGCGSGVTAGAASIDPAVKRLTIVEIEKLVPEVVSTYFADYNFHVVQNPRVRVRIDDGRHYLLTTNDHFDAITADPFDPWVRGAASLYTAEFLEAARAHLNPGGVMTMWVPLYTTTPEAVKSQLATFFAVFPDGFILGNTRNGNGYDVVLIGQRDPKPISLAAIDSRLRQASYGPTAASLGDVGIRSAADLFESYAGRASDLKPWLAGAAINSDRNLRLQYLAGLGINTNMPEAIYKQILEYRGAPDAIFTDKD
jgi:spermidine synthase